MTALVMPLLLERPLWDAEISLTPFVFSDAEPLFDALNDSRVWEHIAAEVPADPASLAGHLRPLESTRLTFTIRRSDEVVGTTAFIWHAANPKGIEIGATRMAPSVWGTGINRRVKNLLIDSAFDGGVPWIRLRTDELNLRSAAAIRKLGARDLGLRVGTRIRRDGSQQHSRFFELRPEDWATSRRDGPAA